MNGVQTRFKCKLDVKRCKRFVFPPSSLLPRSNALKTKAIRYFQTDRTLTRIVSPPLPGIKDVQVAGVPSKKYGEAVGAFIILHEGCTMNEYDVREFCEGKIARYKIPKYIFFVKEFPMTGSGKIQKFKLKDLSLELCKQQGIEII